MDKKAKKHLEQLRQRQQALQRQLSGARKQMDDPREVAALVEELKRVDQEIAKLKASGG